MAKKLLFDLNVDGTAGFETNSKEFYTKCLIGENRSTDLFRQLLVVPESIKLAEMTVEDVLQEPGCDFVSTDVGIKQKTITPEIISIGVELCQWDVEASFLSAYTSNVGAVDFTNTAGLTPEFKQHLLNEVARMASANLEKLTWQGDKNGSTASYLHLADGLEVQLANNNDVIGLTGVGLTAGNILDELEKVYEAIPECLNTNDVTILVSPAALRLYKLATAKNNNINYITAGLADKMIDFNIVAVDGISRNTMVATDVKKNLIYATDLMRDAELQIINLKVTTGDRKVRIIADLKFGVDFLNPQEIVFYN